MKTLIQYLTKIARWLFAWLFPAKKQTNPAFNTPTPYINRYVPDNEKPSLFKFFPPKNNRKRTNGRHLQYIDQYDGTFRFIHHR